MSTLITLPKLSRTYKLEAMSIYELSAYYDLVRNMVDSCLLKLKLQLPNEEKFKINNNRLKYNHVMDYIEMEINKRIDLIYSDNEKNI